jgi:disulfide bond formation protein DsbB
MFSLYTTKILSLLTVASDIAIVIVFIFLLTKSNLKVHKVLSFIGKHSLLLGFLVSLGSVVGSLLYSEVIGYTPCVLCWIQRVFLYPQAVLFGLALIKKDYKILDYSLVLSILGAIVALYHSYTQLGGTGITPCTASGGSCAKVFVLEYGYVTIPMMALTAFALLIVLVLSRKFTQEKILM